MISYHHTPGLNYCMLSDVDTAVEHVSSHCRCFASLGTANSLQKLVICFASARVMFTMSSDAALMQHLLKFNIRRMFRVDQYLHLIAHIHANNMTRGCFRTAGKRFLSPPRVVRCRRPTRDVSLALLASMYVSR